jgi:TRAP-type mannitol/chloroaromatic compound transport system permease small subunit
MVSNDFDTNRGELSIVIRLVKLIEEASEWSGKFVSLFFIPMCLLLVFEVIMRYLFNSPTIFSQELSTIFFGAIGMLGGTYTLLHKSHVNLDILYGRFSAKKRAAIDIITSALFFFFCGLMIWYGSKMTYESIMQNEHSPSMWAPPMYFIKMIIPISATMLFLQGLAKLYRDILTLKGVGKKEDQ